MSNGLIPAALSEFDVAKVVNALGREPEQHGFVLNAHQQQTPASSKLARGQDLDRSPSALRYLSREILPSQQSEDANEAENPAQR